MWAYCICMKGSGSTTGSTTGGNNIFNIFDGTLASGWSLSSGNGGSVNLSSSVTYPSLLLFIAVIIIV